MRIETTLADLATEVGGEVRGDGSVVVDDVTHDSRQAGPGILFVAVRGLTTDGHRFVESARLAGSPAVCVQEPVDDLPMVVVADTRAALGRLAAAVHGHPARSIELIGVTGTNGKTTVTHLLESIVDAAGTTSGLVGTIGAHIGGRPIAIARTTPEAPDFQRLLHRMHDEGVEVAAVEVSSHALAMGRVEGTRFAVVAFTNLSHDHLEFHGDMEAYFAVKASLFAGSWADAAVVWVDDPAGRRIARETSFEATTVGRSVDADLRVVDEMGTIDGTCFTIAESGDQHRIDLALAGEFNVANAAVAAGCALRIGISWDTIAAGIARLATVPGRFEVVLTDEDFTIVVDYAHTPDGIAAAVAAARRLTRGRVLVVVGAGGDRDHTKRPLMGLAAGSADVAVITSDNPRSEDPDAIVAAVAAGVRDGGARMIVEPDRRRAIRAGIKDARAGDILIILGKGHEQGQELAGRWVDFDDRAVALEEATHR